MKKIFTLVFLTVFVLNSIPIFNFALADVKDEIEYELSGGHAVVKGVSDGVTSLVIPEKAEINGKVYPVSEIAEKAFYSNTALTDVVIPDSVTVVGGRAFAGCSSLKNVRMSENVSKLEQYLFSTCTSLERITLPQNTKTVAYGIFKGCTQLEYVTLKARELTITGEWSGESLSTIIEDYGNIAVDAEMRNAKLMGSKVYGYTKFFVANDAVKKMLTDRGVAPSAVFSGEQYGIEENLQCASFTFDAVSTPGGDFAHITGFASGKLPKSRIDLQIPQTLTAGGKTYTVVKISDGAFKKYDIFSPSDRIVSVTFPDTLESIGRYAFQNCGLTTVTIPQSVRIVEVGAFKSCTELLTVNIADGVKCIDTQAFYNCPIRKLVIPESVVNMNLEAVQSCGNLTSLCICPQSLTLGGKLYGVSSGIRVYAFSEECVSQLKAGGVGENRIKTMADGNYIIINLDYKYGELSIVTLNDKTSYKLPAYSRKLFTNIGYTDGVKTYAVGDKFPIEKRISRLTALWEYKQSGEKIEESDVEEAKAVPWQLESIMKKDETAISDNASDVVNVRVNEDRAVSEVNPQIFGVTTCSEIQAGVLMDMDTADLADGAERKLTNINHFTLFRGDTDPYTGLFSDISVYGGNEKSYYLKMLKRAVNSTVEAYRCGNPNAEFIFILPIHPEKSGFDMTPQECVNMHKFLTDDASASDWGALRQSMGFEKVNIIAYELGNETYFNLRKYSDPAIGMEPIDDEIEKYVGECGEYYEALKPHTGDIEYSGVLMSEGSYYWQDEWNSLIIRHLNKYTNGLYSLHTYYGTADSPQKMINSSCDRITALYRKEIGYGSDIRFAHTEHALWGNYNTRGSLQSSLATLSFFTTVLNRSDTRCATYHTFTSGNNKLWNLINDIDGEIRESVVSKAMEFYAENIGDRVIDVTYSDIVSQGTAYPIGTTVNSPNGRVSVLATAKGEDTLILTIANTYSEKSYDSVRLNFDFKNNYTLVSEKVFTAPNRLSAVVSAGTENIASVRENSLNTPNFTSYTIAPHSAVVLVLKTDGKIESNIEPRKSERTPSSEQGLTELLASAESDGNGAYTLAYPAVIDYVDYNGGNTSFRLEGRDVFGNWETVATYDDVKDGRYFNKYTDSYFDTVRLTGAQGAEVKVLGSAGNSVVGSEVITSDFNGCGIGLQNGASQVFADGKWVSAAQNGDFTYGVKDYDSAIKDTGYLDGKYIYMNSVASTADVSDYAAVYYNGSVHGSAGFISADIVRLDAAIEYGIRFLVHDGGKSFYQLGVQKWSTEQNGRSWVLKKVENGTGQTLLNGVYTITQASRMHRFELMFDNEKITWRVRQLGSTQLAASLLGTYTRDESEKCTGSGYTFGFYAFNGVKTGGDKAVCIDNIRAIDFVSADSVFAYTASDGKATITGLAPGAEIYGDTLAIPDKIGGMTVTAIGGSAFEGVQVQKIVLPEGLESIGEKAFFASSVKEVNIPSTVTDWGKSSFQDCAYLREVNIADGVKEIPDAFYNCTSLNYLIVPPSVQTVDANAVNLARMRLIVFEGESVKITNSKILKQGAKLGERLDGDITFYCNNGSMQTCLEGMGLSDVYIREGQYLRIRSTGTKAVTAFFQRGNKATGGKYHYKTLFVYTPKACEGKAALAVFDGASLDNIYTSDIKLADRCHRLVDLTGTDTGTGERGKAVTLIFIDGYENLVPLANVYKSIPW